MALISCPECGKQISDKAISCPDCGRKMSKSKNGLVLLIFLLIGGLALYLYFNYPDNRNEKIKVAKEILKDNSEDLANIATQQIKSPLFSAGLNLLMQNRCDCIIDSLAPKLADKHSLSELNKLKTGAFSNIIELTELVNENEKICEDCLLFRK